MGRTKRERLEQQSEKFVAEPFCYMSWDQFLAKLPAKRRNAIYAIRARLRASGALDPTRDPPKRRKTPKRSTGEEISAKPAESSGDVSEVPSSQP